MHDHAHSHSGHSHGHGHGEARPVFQPSLASMMLMSVPARLMVACGLAVILWALVAWALA